MSDIRSGSYCEVTDVDSRIAALERRIEQLELGMAFRKAAIEAIMNAIREDRGLPPLDFEAEKDLP